jgi:hypothetical protein
MVDESIISLYLFKALYYFKVLTSEKTMMPNNRLLLRALTMNAIFSGFSALFMFVSGSWLATQFALNSAIPVYALAALLALFTLQLVNIVRTRQIRAWEIKGIISGDLAWVAASVAIIILYYQRITTTAVILLDIVAAAVLYLAIQQIRGLVVLRRRSYT